MTGIETHSLIQNGFIFPFPSQVAKMTGFFIETLPSDRFYLVVPSCGTGLINWSCPDPAATLCEYLPHLQPQFKDSADDLKALWRCLRALCMLVCHQSPILVVITSPQMANSRIFVILCCVSCGQVQRTAGVHSTPLPERRFTVTQHSISIITDYS